MNGAEHYREAERLIGIVNDYDSSDTLLDAAELLAMAQVHATLALAAATTLTDRGVTFSSEWRAVLQSTPVQPAEQTNWDGEPF